MKKILLIGALVLTAPVVTTTMTSCDGINMSTLGALGNVANVAGTASEISNLFGGFLNLTSGQKSSVTDIMSNYITGTNGITALAGTSAFAKQLGGLNTNALSGLKGVLDAAQYAKLLGLGGKGSSVTSMLSGFGSGASGLSKDASGVLSNLLLSNL